MPHNHAPAMFIFRTVHFKKHMLTGADTFNWRRKPNKFVKWESLRDYVCSILLLCKEDPVLLILDSHELHFVFPVINTAEGNGSIVLLTLPPHTSHTLQPLNCTIFGPYKHTTLLVWLIGWCQNQTNLLTIYSIAGTIERLWPNYMHGLY
jgi:hypothetical protein